MTYTLPIDLDTEMFFVSLKLELAFDNAMIEWHEIRDKFGIRSEAAHQKFLEVEQKKEAFLTIKDHYHHWLEFNHLTNGLIVKTDNSVPF